MQDMFTRYLSRHFSRWIQNGKFLIGCYERSSTNKQKSCIVLILYVGQLLTKMSKTVSMSIDGLTLFQDHPVHENKTMGQPYLIMLCVKKVICIKIFAEEFFWPSVPRNTSSYATERGYRMLVTVTGNPFKNLN